MIRVHSFDRNAGVRPSTDGTGRHCQNFSFSSFPRQAGALSHACFIMHWIPMTVALPSAYKYCFSAFYGGTVTQLALSS